MVKILHATDVHTDLKKYEAIVNHANNSKVDAVLITGDLTDKDSEAYETAYPQFVQRALVKNGGKFVSRLEEAEKAGDRKKLEEIVKELENSPEDKIIKKEAQDMFRAYQISEMQAIDKILAGLNKPAYAVTGNHDPDFTYKIMENVHFLDKEGSKDIGGIRFAGTPSTYEPVKNISYLDYSHLGDYVIEGEGKVEDSPEYNRLKDENIDVLATHCGLADRLERDTYKNKKPDQVMYRLMKTKSVKLNLSGHFHEELIKRVDDILQLNPGSERVYEIDMYKDKKAGKVIVNEVVVYEYVLDKVGTSKN